MYRVLDVANRSNQRGGRMLSIVDLLKAGLPSGDFRHFRYSFPCR